MAGLVAVSFDPQEAGSRPDGLIRLKQGYLIDLDDAVIAIRQPPLGVYPARCLAPWLVCSFSILSRDLRLAR